MNKASEDRETLFDRLRENPSLWNALLEGMPDGVLLIDKDYLIRDANQAMLEWLGQAKDEIVGKKCHAVVFGSETLCRTRANVCPAVTTFDKAERSGPSEFGRHTPEGDLQYLQIQTFPILDDTGELLYALDFVSDVTAEKLLQAFQEEASLRDPLTGLYNRKAFHIFLDRELKRAQRQKHPICLCLANMDDFKDFNEKQGENAGNKCLDSFGEILLQCTRKEVDLALRLEADTFALILPEACYDTATTIGERIRDVERSSDLPVQFSAAFCQAETDESAEDLIRRTEELLFKVKKSGGNRNL